MPYIYSTMTQDNIYREYSSNGVINVKKHGVLIKGGANVPFAGVKKIFTPLGVATEVSDSDLEFLQKNDAFNRHLKRGFLKIEDRKTNADKIAKDMNPKDKSAPKTEKDLKSTMTKEFKESDLQK